MNMMAQTALCPCCAYSMLAPRRRATAFSYTPAASPATVAHGRTGSDAAPPKGGSLWIDGGTVVDPRDGSLAANVDILIAGGRIAAVVAAGTPKADPSLPRIDATGRYVVPGYNDMHSHVLELENPSGALALMLAEGITGFRQMSGSPGRLEERRDGRLPIGDVAPAVLEMPGTLLTPLNAASTDAAVAEIRAQKAQGADFIKVGFVSPSVFLAALAEAKAAGVPILGHLQDGIDAETASRAGFKSIEHLGPGATVWTACSTAEEELKAQATPARIKAPPVNVPFLRRLIMWRLQTMLINPAAFAAPSYVAGMQRAFDTFSDTKCKALAARFAAEGTWHVPTLVRLRTQELADAPQYADHPYLRYMPDGKIRKWRKVTERFRRLPAAMRATYAEAYPRQLALTARLSENGVRMMTGTDGGWLSAPGLTLKEEFAELEKAGFASLAILQMTTINVADYLGRTATMGTVAPGRNADLVLLEANPLDRVENLSAIAGVVRDGVHYSKQELEALRTRVADRRGTLQ